MKQKHVLAILLIWVLGILIYSNTFHSSWHFDDLGYIVNNETIRNITDWEALLNGYASPERIVGLYSFALNYHFGQSEIFGYHLVNIAIHLIGASLVYWFLWLLLRTPKFAAVRFVVSKRSIALMAALIFLTHPLQTQAVTYVCQRFASLATLFYILTLCLYLAGRLRQKGGWILWGGAGISALLGMFTKQITLTIPVAIIFIDLVFYQQARGIKDVLTKIKWQYLVILACVLIIPGIYSFRFIAILSQTVRSSGSFRGESFDLFIYLLTQFRVVFTYIKILFAPLGQNLLYDFHVSPGILHWPTILSFACLSTIFIAGVYALKRNALIGFGILWFFICLSVESGIITIRHVIFEHRLYLPMIAFSLFVVGMMLQFIKEEKKFKIIGIVLIACLSVLTYQRNAIWKDEFTLWEDVARKAPHKMRPYLNIGIAYSSAGQ